MKKLLANKESILDGLRVVQDVSRTFTNEEYTFLVTLIENVEEMQKDALRYKMWKELIGDDKLVSEVEKILDKYLNKV